MKTKYDNIVRHNIEKIIKEQFDGNQSAFVKRINEGFDKSILTESWLSQYLNQNQKSPSLEKKNQNSVKTIRIEKLGQIADALGITLSELVSENMDPTQKKEYEWSDIYRLIFTMNRITENVKIIEDKSDSLYQDIYYLHRSAWMERTEKNTIPRSDIYSLVGVAFPSVAWVDNMREWNLFRRTEYAKKYPQRLEELENSIIAKSHQPLVSHEKQIKLVDYSEDNPMLVLGVDVTKP